MDIFLYEILFQKKEIFLCLETAEKQQFARIRQNNLKIYGTLCCIVLKFLHIFVLPITM
jgi:hypothetical protein